MEQLFNSGALDVFYTSIHMKKNRPAYKLSVICKENNIDDINEIIFKETTTIGTRMYKVNRICMDRSFDRISTLYGDVKIKVVSYKDATKYYPEYEDCRKLAVENNVSLSEIYELVKNNIYCSDDKI